MTFFLQAVIVVYGFYHPHLLNQQIQVSENQNFYKRHILKIILRGPVLCFLAAIFSFFFIPLVSSSTHQSTLMKQLILAVLTVIVKTVC